MLRRILTLTAAALTALGISLPAAAHAAPAPAAAPTQTEPWPDTSGDWKACSAPVWPDKPTHGQPGQGRRVLVVGDSLTRESRTYLERSLRKSGWTPTVRCWGGKTATWGVEQLRIARAAGHLPRRVVFALGTNDAYWYQDHPTQWELAGLAADLDEARRVIGAKREMWVLTIHIDRGSVPLNPAKMNAVIRSLSAEHDNVHLIPFSKRLQQARERREGLHTWDGVHFNTDGYRWRARLISAYLNEQATPTLP